MIHHILFILPGNPEKGEPTVVGKEIVEAPCGCCVRIGLRTDTREVASVVKPCGPDHEQLMTEFLLRMKESLVEPENRPLVDVVEEMLDKLYDERVASA